MCMQYMKFQLHWIQTYKPKHSFQFYVSADILTLNLSQGVYAASHWKQYSNLVFYAQSTITVISG